MAIGLILLIQTTILCFIRTKIYRRFWFSYILFTIIIGGILILFINITRLASNEIFSPSKKILMATRPLIYNTNCNQECGNNYARYNNRKWNHKHNNCYIQPNNRNYNKTTYAIYITNTNCSRKHHQCIQEATKTHIVRGLVQLPEMVWIERISEWRVERMYLISWTTLHDTFSEICTHVPVSLVRKHKYFGTSELLTGNVILPLEL